MKAAVTAALLVTWLGAGNVHAQRRDGSLEPAWDLIAKGQPAKAIELLRSIIETEPANGEARLMLGSLLMEARQRNESLAELAEAVRLLPKSAVAHNALGEAYSAFGEATAARPEYERAVELDPAFAQAQGNLGAVLLEQGEPDRAEKHLDRAIALFGKKPDAAYTLYLRAKIDSDRREAAKAAALLERAVALRPDFAEAWSDLGEAREALFEDAKAIAALERAVQLSPEDAVARTRLGSKLLDMGNAHAAIPHLEEAARLDPKNQSTLNALQLALRKDGRVEDANAIRRRLAQLLHERDRADQALVASLELNNRGVELKKRGDLRGASEKFESALKMNPEHVGIRTNLAVTLLQLGRWKEGLAELREAVRRDPANTELRKALEDALAQARAHGVPLDQP